MSELRYQYTDSNQELKEFVITDTDTIADIRQAQKDYEISKSIIHSQLVHVWNWSLRAYHMGVKDREIRAQLKNWQSNIAF